MKFKLLLSSSLGGVKVNISYFIQVKVKMNQIRDGFCLNMHIQ